MGGTVIISDIRVTPTGFLLLVHILPPDKSGGYAQISPTGLLGLFALIIIQVNSGTM